MQGGVLLKFIDRKHELEALDRFYSTKGAGLLVMLAVDVWARRAC
jgi:hypothetical protein